MIRTSVGQNSDQNGQNVIDLLISVITLTQNAIKGAWKGLRRCYIKKTSLNHPKLYSMFAILQCHALKVLWWSQSLKIFMRLSSSRDGFKLRRAAAFAVMFCASLPSSNNPSTWISFSWNLWIRQFAKCATLKFTFQNFLCIPEIQTLACWFFKGFVMHG